MSEENKALARRHIEAINNKDVDGFARNYADDVAYQGTDGELKGPEAITELLNVFLGAFPDLAVTVDDVVAEGDKVVLRSTGRGTHTGDLQGIPPTGKSMTISAIDIFRMSGGRIAEQWEMFDQMGMMQQLGVIPAPGESG